MHFRNHHVTVHSLRAKLTQVPEWVTHPTTVQLDTHNRCNLACRYCNVQHSFNLPRGTMKLETVKTVLRELRGNGVKWVAPFMNGEPLLEQRLPLICDWSQRFGCSNVLVTNGTVFQNRRLLVHPNLRKVRFTISAATPETYRRVHGKPLYHKAVSTYEWFMEHKLPGQTGWLHFITCRDNQHELEQWLHLWLGRKRIVFPVHMGLEQSNSRRTRTADLQRPYVVDEQGHAKQYGGLLWDWKPCPCWDILGVGWRGEIMQCVDYPYKYNYGRVGEVDLLDAWQQRNRNRMDNPCCRSCSQRYPNYKRLMEKYVQ